LEQLRAKCYQNSASSAEQGAISLNQQFPLTLSITVQSFSSWNFSSEKREIPIAKALKTKTLFGASIDFCALYEPYKPWCDVKNNFN
jgi:hypothetical protein